MLKSKRSQRDPAVGDKDGAGRKVGCGRCQENSQPGDINRLADAAGWRSGEYLLHEVFVCPQGAREFCLDEAWRNRIDLDIVASEFQREGLG